MTVQSAFSTATLPIMQRKIIIKMWDSQKKDHIRLRGALLQSNRKFLVSYNDCPEIWEMWNQPGIQIETVSWLNNIVQRYEDGKMCEEVFISNYDTNKRAGNGQLSLWDAENFENTLPV